MSDKGVGSFLANIFKSSKPAKDESKTIKPKQSGFNKKQNTKGKQQAAQKPMEKNQKQSNFKGDKQHKVNPQPVKQTPTRQTSTRQPTHDVNRKYYSSEQSKEIYGTKTMEQNIFMYCPPSKFLAVQQYINQSYEGVILVGTSNLSKVNEEYETKLNCKHLVVFIDSEEELQGLYQLIQTAINIKSTNVEILHIYLIITNKSVNRARIQNLNNSHLTNIFKLDAGLDKLSTGVIDQIMAKIIEKQPAYVRENKIQPPQVAKKKDTLSGQIFKLKNLDELRDELKKLSESKGDANYGELEDKITYAKSQDDAEAIRSMIPELSILEEYRETLDEYLELAGENVDAKTLNEIIISKLEVSVLQEQVLKDIFGSLIETAKHRAELEDERVRKTNENALEVFKPLAEDNDLKDMLSERAKLKNSVTEGFRKYRKEVQLVTNAIEARRYLFQDVQKSLQEVIVIENDDVEDRIIETAINLQQNLEKSKNEMIEDKRQVEQRLVRTLNFTNSLLRDYNVIVSLDEIIIDKLIEDNQRLSVNNLVQVYNIDNPLKAKSKTLILLDKDDFLKLSTVMFLVDTLVVTNLEFNIGKRMTEMGLNQFLEEEYTNKDINVIRLGNENLEPVKENLIKKLKYLTRNFTKIVFLLDEEANEDVLNMALDNSTEISYLTSTNEEQLLKLNELRGISDTKDIYGTTVIVNNWDRDKAGQDGILSLSEIRVLGNFKDNTRELFINTKQAMKDKELIKELVLLFRNL